MHAYIFSNTWPDGDINNLLQFKRNIWNPLFTFSRYSTAISQQNSFKDFPIFSWKLIFASNGRLAAVLLNSKEPQAGNNLRRHRRTFMRMPRWIGRFWAYSSLEEGIKFPFIIEFFLRGWRPSRISIWKFGIVSRESETLKFKRSFYGLTHVWLEKKYSWYQRIGKAWRNLCTFCRG